jgi:putative toxin-antitoxin system antitoxin component (TIGR02293 family)
MTEAVMDEAKTKTATPPVHSIPDSGYSLANPLSLVDLIRAGVPWSLYRGVMTNLGLTDQVAAGVLHIPPRTLARRKGGRLEPEEGERLMRLVRLVAQATEVLGSQKKAVRWLESPNRALGGATPMSLLDTDVGTQAAEAVLTRIEYGVFS